MSDLTKLVYGGEARHELISCKVNILHVYRLGGLELVEVSPKFSPSIKLSQEIF